MENLLEGVYRQISDINICVKKVSSELDVQHNPLTTIKKQITQLSSKIQSTADNIHMCGVKAKEISFIYLQAEKNNTAMMYGKPDMFSEGKESEVGVNYFKTAKGILQTVAAKFDKNSTTGNGFKFAGSSVGLVESISKFWGGDKEGVQGFIDLSGMASSSASFWKSMYNWFSKIKPGVTVDIPKAFSESVGKIGGGFDIVSKSLKLSDTMSDGSSSVWNVCSSSTGLAGSAAKFITDFKSTPVNPIGGITGIATKAFDKIDE